MERELFERYVPASAITEPIKVQNSTSNGLECAGVDFYRYLLARDHGRLAWAFLGKLNLHDVFAYRHASRHKVYAAAEPYKGLNHNGIW
ncbi:MAG: hypothetical protein ACOH2I_06010 [Pseudomonas sp.]